MGRRIRVGDLVQVIAGAERGKQGKVIGLDPKANRVRVEKVRMQKHHLRPGRKASRTGGILEQEGYIHASNVMLVDPDTHRPARVGFERDDKGRSVRVFRKSGTRATTSE